MEKTKLSLANLQGKLSQAEMKNVMAGSKAQFVIDMQVISRPAVITIHPAVQTLQDNAARRHNWA